MVKFEVGVVIGVDRVRLVLELNTLILVLLYNMG
jgi:hypothetical protein